MFMRLAVATVFILGWAAGNLSAGELGVGDPAPKLAVKEFVKGDPVANLEKGKTYVVEFWATWCGPCRTSIPHLTKLQKKHKEVVFIGVSVFESDQKLVKPFVEKMGEQMGYRVAMDDVPEGSKANEGQMAKSWMDASGQEGIPTAFVINGEGKIAWIGHPMAMDKPLEQTASGSWDLQVAATKFKEDQAQRRKLRELIGRLVKAQQSGDPKAVLTVLDEAIADDPKLESQLGLQKFNILAAQADASEKALEYGKRLAETVWKNDADGLNNLAWVIVDPEAKKKPDAALVKLALSAAQRADELTQGKSGPISDTLAKAYFDSGDAAKALELQERALELIKGTPLEKDIGMKNRLEQYRKAAKK